MFHKLHSCINLYFEKIHTAKLCELHLPKWEINFLDTFIFNKVNIFYIKKFLEYWNAIGTKKIAKNVLSKN